MDGRESLVRCATKGESLLLSAPYPAVRRGRCLHRPLLPRICERGCRIGVVDGKPLPLAPLPLPGPARAALSEAGSAERAAGPCGLCPTQQFRFAWRKTERFSKTGPAPNTESDNDHHGLFLGPPYFKQIRRISAVLRLSGFLLTGRGRFLLARQKKMGAHSRLDRPLAGAKSPGRLIAAPTVSGRPARPGRCRKSPPRQSV